MSAKIYVGNLSWSTTDDALRDAFGAYGNVLDSIVMRDRETGRSRGFGFVTYSSQDEANNAIMSLNEQELDGRRIKVNLANARTTGGYSGGNNGPSGYGGQFSGYGNQGPGGYGGQQPSGYEQPSGYGSQAPVGYGNQPGGYSGNPSGGGYGGGYAQNYPAQYGYSQNDNPNLPPGGYGYTGGGGNQGSYGSGGNQGSYGGSNPAYPHQGYGSGGTRGP